jgi:hypothetical protein
MPDEKLQRQLKFFFLRQVYTLIETVHSLHLIKFLCPYVLTEIYC